MQILTIGAMALLMLFTTGCHGIAKAPSTTPAVSVEQQIYADLYTAQNFLEGLKAQPTVATKIKTQLNQAIAVYNLVEKSFADYEIAKSANLAKPEDLLKVQAMVLDMKTQITTVGDAFQAKEE